MWYHLTYFGSWSGSPTAAMRWRWRRNAADIRVNECVVSPHHARQTKRTSSNGPFIRRSSNPIHAYSHTLPPNKQRCANIFV
uniref:MIP27550p n=1 Tax=Drosophila melanogaster TaxID=7227 RepID=E3CTR5_DROME|nr:MIP27550p [Drosophila melanogaster]